MQSGTAVAQKIDFNDRAIDKLKILEIDPYQ
jgi:hypothetical protein